MTSSQLMSGSSPFRRKPFGWQTFGPTSVTLFGYQTVFLSFGQLTFGPNSVTLFGVHDCVAIIWPTNIWPNQCNIIWLPQLCSFNFADKHFDPTNVTLYRYQTMFLSFGQQVFGPTSVPLYDFHNCVPAIWPTSIHLATHCHLADRHLTQLM